jgi:outer membrane protein assembly factor BamA
MLSPRGLGERGMHYNSLFILVAALLAGGSPACAAAETTYILNGYRLSGAQGVNPEEMTAQLKHQAGARITEADIMADTQALALALRARHVPGQLFTTMAEKNGRVWILFDMQDAGRDAVAGPTAHGKPPQRFGSQHFAGNTKVSSAALSQATGLQPGQTLPADWLDSAQIALSRAYQSAMPGAVVKVKATLRHAQNGEVTINWDLTEPKS